MKFIYIFPLIAPILVQAAPTELSKRASVQGFDISHYQTSVDCKKAYSDGARFVIIKATEGTDYQDPSFSSHYDCATNAGLIRGGYHFAQPSESSGAAQANYFLAHGGGWSKDGRTLPGMIDLEAGCHGLSTSAMVSWLHDFVNTYHSKTGRYPLIYTNRSWWDECTGNSKAFSTTSPLVLASWNSSPGTIPGGWPFQTFWQNADSSPWGGDHDIFNGDLTQLKKIATG